MNTDMDAEYRRALVEEQAKADECRQWCMDTSLASGCWVAIVAVVAVLNLESAIPVDLGLILFSLAWWRLWSNLARWRWNHNAALWHEYRVRQMSYYARLGFRRKPH